MAQPQGPLGSAPPDAGSNALVSPKSTETLLRPSDESEHAHGQLEPGSISAQCLSFMENVNSTFGNNSREQTAIYKALYEFKVGRLSKRDTHRTMLEAIGENTDLKHGLVKVFQHQDSRWSDGDFYQPPVEQTEPASSANISQHVLQQPHEQRPPTQVSWTSSQYLPPPQFTIQSINPAVLHTHASQHGLDRTPALQQLPNVQDMLNYGNSGYGLFTNYEETGTHEPPRSTSNQHTYLNGNPFFTPNELSSPTPSFSVWNLLPHQYESPSIGQPSAFPSYNGQEYDMGFNLPPYDGVEPADRSCSLHEGYGGVNNWVDWHGAGHHSHSERYRVADTQPPPHSPDAMNDSTPQLTPPYSSSLNRTPPVLRTPINAQVVQSPLDIVPPQHPLLGGPIASRDAEMDSKYEADSPFSSSSPSIQPSSGAVITNQPENAPSDNKTKQRVSRDPPQFIHGLCGKAFYTRSAVKKHHWGRNGEDIATKTGCWVKNNRPNREWDEHPSCQQILSRSCPDRKIESASKSVQPQMSTSSEHGASVNPSTITKASGIIPGFPTLQELPKAVADMVHARPSFTEEPMQNYGSGPASRSSFDSLLTVVNLASQIDAPRPQLRSDSVVPNLNAKVTTAEGSRQNNGQSSHGCGYARLGYENHHKLNDDGIYGLGTIQFEEPQVPMGKSLVAQREIAMPETRGYGKPSTTESTMRAFSFLPQREPRGDGEMSAAHAAEPPVVRGNGRRISSKRNGGVKREQKMLD